MPSVDILDGTTWDVFLSHASEDKVEVAVPLSQALQRLGVTVWLDQAELRIGDSLRRRIDQAIASSRFAAVVLSEPYMAKGWTQYELDGIVTLSLDGKQNLLPIWHGVGKEEVAAYSPHSQIGSLCSRRGSGQLSDQGSRCAGEDLVADRSNDVDALAQLHLRHRRTTDQEIALSTAHSC